MRVLVTGATGFVGGWLVKELTAAGHDPIAAPSSADLDISDALAVARFMDSVRPDAVAHFAGVAFAPDARRDPNRAFRVNERGTRAVVSAVSACALPAPVLVAGSSDVYGRPEPHDLPLRETAPLRPQGPYGRSKLAQERAAIATGMATGVRVAVTRTFNQLGPGQRADFVAPALARRVLNARATGSNEIEVGSVDVRRDFGDVRDAVRAYRAIVEALVQGSISTGTVLNVATGRATSIRTVLDLLCEIVGVTVRTRVNRDLIRRGDPPEIVGDSTRLRELTGWAPKIPLEQTLSDLLASIEDPVALSRA